MLISLLIAADYLCSALLFAVPPLWQSRRWAVPGMLLLTAFATGLGVVYLPPVLAGLHTLAGAYRCINEFRIITGRMHESYLHRVARRTTWCLLLVQVVLWGIWYAAPLLSNRQWLFVLGGVQVAAAVLTFLITRRHLRRSAYREPKSYLSDKELPTLTVAIPARNETTDLEQCLRSLLASDYPKLQIIVLDDCSQAKTADVIRQFAHDGVQFIRGAEPQDRWLAKNQAYEALTAAANGDFILFCGVDIRFEPGTLRAVVNAAHDRKKDMLCIVPHRDQSDQSLAVIQPIRYWWELSLPRVLFRRPPVLSSCWLIRRRSLNKLGGFQAVSHTIIPEGYFARELIKKDAYSLLLADGELMVRTEKSAPAQRDTAIRTRYPLLHRRPEMVMAVSLAYAVLLIGPFIWIPIGLLGGLDKLLLLPAAAILFLTATHTSILQATNPANTLTGLFNLPFAAATELYLLHVSMFKYEFSEVVWKGRNICIPVMHVIPRLPKLDKEP